MTTKFYYFAFILFSYSCVFGVSKYYWDLGVVIDKKENIIIQNEINLSTIESSENIASTYEDVNAFRANNFIAPILHNLKYPIFNNTNKIKPNNEFIFSLSTPETLNFIKKSFLKDHFSQFFSLYGQIKIKEVPTSETINSLYIQNLYRTNQFNLAIEMFDKISLSEITDELLLYKIKTNIQLRRFNEAHAAIELFQTQFKDSDLLKYVTYEQQLLNNKNEK